MRELDEQALRLDTALVFDEVRSLATLEERQRLAREIHDGVAQEIAVARLRRRRPRPPRGHRRRSAPSCTALRAEISRVVSELRLSIFDLRSEISPAAGLGSALSDYVRDRRRPLRAHRAPHPRRGTRPGCAARSRPSCCGSPRRRSPTHASTPTPRTSGSTAAIRPPFARITVQDDGTGLGRPARADSYGLKIMRERAERIGAHARDRHEVRPRRGPGALESR